MIKIIPLFNNWKKIEENKRKNAKGTVISFIDSIVTIVGMGNIKMGEILEIKGLSAKIIVVNIYKNDIKGVILSGENEIAPGNTVIRTNELFRFPITTQLLGRVVNAFGTPIDLNSKFKYKVNFKNINVKAPGIISRYKVNEPLQTGIKAVDCLVPIGRGQRELIIGDKSTGKTSVAIDAILNQKLNAWKPASHVHCIYVSIGQRRANVAKLANLLKKKK